MTIKDCILVTYPIVRPYESIKSIENRLKEKHYLVVTDEKNKFYGILTPSDILAKPCKLVIDCLTPKGIIQTDDSFGELIGKFEMTPSEALPVFQCGEYLGILEKNDAIKKLQYKLDDFRNELMISRAIKTAFLQNISHEVRTPLNHILGFMSIITDLSSDELEPNRDEFYTIIRKSSEQFLSIMNDLIELSHLYSGDQLCEQNQDTSIESIFADVKANFESKAILYNNELTISYHNPDKSLRMYTDSKKIKLIIQRLINSIIKQAQKDDFIEFGYELSPEKQEIRFYARNTHSQMADVPEKIQSHARQRGLYPEFSFQYESDFSMELAKKMIELFGGTLETEGLEADNQSICFTIPYHAPKSTDECG
ncbi:MAG: CBS domain-containing protein [Prolixibacteraceae bacterium]|nr:CBS domain-containing protein [Prolixibacteraceae bacterium]